MRRTDSIASLLAIAGIALLLGGCRQQTELPDLSGLGAITTISREDGSGTKAEFENLIHLQQNASDTEADSTENVINQISASKGAIGYAAFSSVKDIKNEDSFRGGNSAVSRHDQKRNLSAVQGVFTGLHR